MFAPAWTGGVGSGEEKFSPYGGSQPWRIKSCVVK
jgi:hypothetical protein